MSCAGKFVEVGFIASTTFCAPFQLVSVFSSFGFKWPVQLTKLFSAASMSSFNDQLMAPECSIGTWSFEMKCV
jgi:hypothetical protein